MPFDISTITARSRTVDIDGVGPVVIVEPSMADYMRANSDPYWWVQCIKCVDGTPFLAKSSDMGKVHGDIATVLLAEVTKKRPTQPLKSGCGETLTTEDA